MHRGHTSPASPAFGVHPADCEHFSLNFETEIKLRGNTKMEYKGIEYLRKKLAQKKSRIDMRYNYYEMKNANVDFRLTNDDRFRWLKEVLGWCAKSVDSLADRLVFDSFEEDNFELNTIYRMNNADILFDSAVLSALICSCSFIYISPDEDGYPRLQVIDASDATGIIDPITGMLQEGYAVLERDESRVPILEAYFIPGRTDYYSKGKVTDSWTNKAPYPLLVPIIYRPDAKRPFGHSRISRASIGIMQGALRTLKRSEIAGEFYSFPQKYVLGMDPEAEQLDTWRATISSFLRFDMSDNGEAPRVGQFQQQSMSPYTEQLRMFASLFAGETGLTMDDLGFVTDNPSSAEAIKAAHENLRLTARKAQRTFGSGFLNAGYLAACVRDDYGYKRNQLYRTKPTWAPIFEPDAAMLSGIGDGAIKVNQAVPGYFDRTNLKHLTGVEPGEGSDGGYGTGALGANLGTISKESGSGSNAGSDTEEG